MRKVTIITGPTCSGKTACSIEFAERFGAEIISCDSVQVYRGADIGSAKVSLAERKRVRHHLIDVVEPDGYFNVSDYIERAKAAIDDIFSRGKKVAVVGGSGFYLKAWFGAVVDSIQIPPPVESFVEGIAAGGAQALAAELLKADASASKFLDINNPRRTKNALKRVLASGLSVEELAERFRSMPSPFGELEKDVIFLNPEDSDIRPKIELRTDAMLAGGLVKEVETLLEKYAKLNPSLESAIGYRETIDFIRGKIATLGELRAAICRDTRLLVKKQRSFFKSQLGLV